jgi:hypothetical protein
MFKALKEWSGALGLAGAGIFLYAAVIIGVLGFWAVVLICAVKLVRWAWGG